MTDPSDAELDLLLELQATDHRLRKVIHRLDELPEQRELDAAEARVAEREAHLAGLVERLTQAEQEAGVIDKDIGTLTERRDVERSRLYSGAVTNQREMSSVEAEIESTDARIIEHEEDLLVVLERIEDLEGQRDTTVAELEAAQEVVATATTARDDAAKQLLVDIAEGRSVRGRQTDELPTELLSRYEQAAERGGGTGVGELDQGACSACRLTFSMVDLDELYHGPPLATCPHCRRLLVVGRG